MNNKWIAAAALTAVLLSGCGSKEDEAPAEEFAPAAPAPTPTAIVTEVPSTGAVTMFGDTSAVSEGISASVVPAGLRTIGDEDVAVVEVRLDNTAAVQIDNSAVSVSITYGSSPQVMETVSDEATGVGAGFGTIMPGESRSALIGVKATRSEADNLRVAVTGPAGGNPAVFIGPFSDQDQ